MSEKSPLDIADVSHNEQNATHEPVSVDTGRRKSVALNIVENPLKVSFALSESATSQMIVPSINADLLTLTAHLTRADRCQCSNLC